MVTIDIGANNVTSCVPAAGATCPGITKVVQDQPRILKALRAAYPALPIVGMNYYDPFLAEWLQGPAGQARAKVSVGMTNTFNNVLKQAYTAFRVPVANVSAAFFTNIFTPVPVVKLPLSLTWPQSAH